MANLRINDFSGGVSDKDFDTDPKFAKTVHNLVLNEKNRLVQREGFNKIFSDTNPFGTQEISYSWVHYTESTTVPSNSNATKYAIFIYSNGAFKVTFNNGTSWKTVECKEDPNFLWDLASRVNQYTYTRISDLEFILCGTFGGDRAIKFFRHANGDWEYAPLGLPRYQGTLQILAASGSKKWAYALVLKHQYSLSTAGSQNITKIVRGSPQYSSVITGDVGNVITIPAFNNSVLFDYVDNSSSTAGDACYDLSRMEWEIYRTEDNGTIFYKLGTFSISGGNYTDTTADASLISGEKLYTTGGVFENGMMDKKPEFSTFANNALWVADTKYIYQSKIGIPDAFPGSFRVESPEGGKITGLNHIDIYPIVGTNTGLYRLEGLVDDLGNGSHRLRTISREHGVLSNRTMVKLDRQIAYLSDDGIRITDGYTSRKISGHWDEGYKKYFKGSILYNGARYPRWKFSKGVWDKVNNRIYWFLPSPHPTVTAEARDYICVDMSYQHEYGYPITTGQTRLTVVAVTSADGFLQIGTTLGEILGQDGSTNKDVSSNINISNPDPYPIKWEYESNVLSFGSSIVRKWFTLVLIHLRNLSDITFKVWSDTKAVIIGSTTQSLNAVSRVDFIF